MKRAISAFLAPVFAGAFVLSACIFPAQAQTTSATVVATCGTPPATYTAGANRALTQDTTGTLCASSGGGSSNPVGITPTDHTITSASGSSQQIMAAKASRHSLTIQNTGNANCGVNPTGGVSAIGGAGTITLQPYGSYSPRVPTLSAVTVICTAGQPIYGDDN